MSGNHELTVHRFEHEAMATTFEVLIAGKDASYACQVSMEVFREIDRLEKILSRFEPGSDIVAINRLKPGESVPVGLETVECLELAWRVWKETGGAFDICYAARSTKEAEGEGAEGVDGGSAGAPRGLERLAILQGDAEHPGFSVGILPVPGEESFGGVKIDLGGIGKGYALDKAAELLADWDVDCALLNSGTSTVLAVGPAQEGGWPLGIGGPWGSVAGMRRVMLRNRALSGSGTEVKGQHIVDPRTGRPATAHLAAWVAAPSAALSDALSTALFVMSPEEAGAYCESHPEISAFLVSKGAPGEPDVVKIHGTWQPVGT